MMSLELAVVVFCCSAVLGYCTLLYCEASYPLYYARRNG